jgi:putative SOS response-associated peptidase YedK
MCGRYKFSPGEFADLRIRWNLDGDLPLFSSYNIAPTQNVPVVVQKDGHNQADLFRWGLVPFWAKDIGIGNQMINARAGNLWGVTSQLSSDFFHSRRKNGGKPFNPRFYRRGHPPISQPASRLVTK